MAARRERLPLEKPLQSESEGLGVLSRSVHPGRRCVSPRMCDACGPASEQDGKVLIRLPFAQPSRSATPRVGLLCALQNGALMDEGWRMKERCIMTQGRAPKVR